MSLLGRAFKLAFRPLLHVGAQMRQSAARLDGIRRTHEEQIAQRLAQARLGGQLDAGERFEELFKENGWDEQSLAQQLLAVRRTKAAALLASGVAMIAGLVVLVMAPLWMLIIFVPAVAGLASLGLASALKFALFQAQIESRRLISFREYLCRPDMVAHLLGRRAR